MLNKTKKLLMTVAVILSSAITPLAVQCSYGQDVWLVPKGGPGGAEDYNDLFVPRAPWTRAATRVKAFELSIKVLTTSSDAELKQIFDGLRERHIALALDMLPLTGGPDKCGFHVEGYSAAGQTRSIARRVKALGGEPQFYDMDEPLYYGHFYDKQNACHSSIEDVAADAGEKVKELRSIFPAVEVGESEPIQDITRDGFGDLKKWLEAFQTASGEPLSFLRLDMNWNADWRKGVTALAQLLSAKGVRLQIIYNGSGRDRSDEEWTSHALANARAFESVLKPDAVAIQTWNAFPKHVLPETDPKTLTGLVDQYIALRGSR
jgi:hypothetical protein